MKSLIFATLLFSSCLSLPQNKNSDELSEKIKATKFITKAEAQMKEVAQKLTKFNWAFQTNITDENEANKLEYQVGSGCYKNPT